MGCYCQLYYHDCIIDVFVFVYLRIYYAITNTFLCQVTLASTLAASLSSPCFSIKEYKYDF